MRRPRSIAEIARRASDGVQEFDLAVREFVDSWGGMSPAEREQALVAEPAPLGGVKDAYVAAVAEHLAATDGLQAPPWTEQSIRFLHEPFFAGGLESLKAILIAESPTAFRRRLIFVSADTLSRPHGTAAQRALPP